MRDWTVANQPFSGNVTAPRLISTIATGTAPLAVTSTTHAVGYVPDPGAAAGTTHFLREDATWATIPASGVSEATWVGFTPSTFGTSSPVNLSETTLPSSHTLVRFTIWVQTPALGCTTSMVMSFRDLNIPSNLANITITNGASANFFDSGALSVAMTGGHTFAFEVTTASSGCTTQPAIGNFTVVFQ